MRLCKALNSAEADVGHPLGKVRGGVQITRFGATPSAQLGIEPADHIDGYMRVLSRLIVRRL
jgi:hypothetical protein